MPKRTRSHQIEEQSRNSLRKVFYKRNWIVWDITSDYGEDQFVRIVDGVEVTPYSFFIQAKSTDNIDEHINREENKLRYRIKTDHIQLWNQLEKPVFLTLWDAKTDTTYWECIQDYLQKYDVKIGENQKTITIKIPVRNILDEEALKQIISHTKARFKRFEKEREGAKVIVKMLEEALQAKIEYDPQREYLAINFSDASQKVVYFGEEAKRLKVVASTLDIEIEGEGFKRIISFFRAEAQKVLDEYQREGMVTVRDDKGNVIETFDTLEDYYFHLTTNTDDFFPS